MRFDFEGKTFAIDFERQRPRVHLPYPIQRSQGNVVRVCQEARYPSTTVNILEVRQDLPAREWSIYRTATVGCWHRDHFNRERGRLNALKLVTRTIPDGMKPRLWNAYLSRKKGA